MPVSRGADMSRPAFNWAAQRDMENAERILEMAGPPEAVTRGEVHRTPYGRPMAIDGGSPQKLFELPTNVAPEAGLRWSPDGKSITFINNERDVSNLWSQPIQGNTPKALTHFESGEIYRFAWSPSGKQVVLERGVTRRDVILVGGFSS
jgi:hypothetical protein